MIFFLRLIAVIQLKDDYFASLTFDLENSLLYLDTLKD